MMLMPLYHTLQLAMKACPYRKDFYAKLGSPPEKVHEELVKWLDALEKIVKQMQDFYQWVTSRKGVEVCADMLPRLCGTGRATTARDCKHTATHVTHTHIMSSLTLLGMHCCHTTSPSRLK